MSQPKRRKKKLYRLDNLRSLKKQRKLQKSSHPRRSKVESWSKRTESRVRWRVSGLRSNRAFPASARLLKSTCRRRLANNSIILSWCYMKSKMRSRPQNWVWRIRRRVRSRGLWSHATNDTQVTRTYCSMKMALICPNPSQRISLLTSAKSSNSWQVQSLLATYMTCSRVSSVKKIW